MSDVTWFISWYRPQPGIEGWLTEPYTDEDEALAKWREYSRDYPHNTYYLSKVTGVAVATKKEEDPVKWHLSPIP